MSAQNPEVKRGFTAQEKWVIWGVFCLLVGLSTHRLSVFAGMLLLSAGGSLLTRKSRVGLAVVLCIVGVLNLVFSKYLI